jgi:hypothetical protein
MNPRQQSVPRRHIPEGLDGRKKSGVGAEAARPRAHFMACKRSQLGIHSELTSIAAYLLPI